MRRIVRAIAGRALAAGLAIAAIAWATAPCTALGGHGEPGVQILQAAAADDYLYFEVQVLIPETHVKEVTVEVDGLQSTQQITYTVLTPISETKQWPLAEAKVYRGDRRRVPAGEVGELLAEPQYVLVCWPGEKLPLEWVELLRPETLVVVLSAPQVMAVPAAGPEGAPAPQVIEAAPPPVPVETAPEPPAPVEPVPQPAPAVVPVPAEGAAPRESAGASIPPSLAVAKVEDDQFVFRSVFQHEFTQTLMVSQTDAEGRVECRPVLQTMRSKTETLTQIPLDAIHAWQTDGTEVSGDDLAERLTSFTGVFSVSLPGPVAQEVLDLFQEGVLVIQSPDTNAAPVMPAPGHEGGPPAPSEEGAPQA